MKTPERRHWRLCGVFSVNLEHISHLFLLFLLLTLNNSMYFLALLFILHFLLHLSIDRSGYPDWSQRKRQSVNAENWQFPFPSGL